MNKINIIKLVLSLLTLSVLSLANAKDSFSLKKIVVTGDYPKVINLKTIVQKYHNKKFSILMLQNLKREIKDFFVKKGYLLTIVRIPKQDLTDGTLRVEVDIAKIDKVNISGNKNYTKKFIRKSINIKEGQYLNNQKLIKYLMLLNEYSDLEVKSFLKKGKKINGTDLNLIVKDSRPFHGYISFDNQGSKDISTYRASFNTTYGNLFKEGDKTSLDATLGIKSSSSKLTVLNYDTTSLNRFFTKLKFGYVYANYIATGDFSILSLKGDTNIFTVGVSQPIIRSIKNSLDFNMDFQKVDTKNYLLGSISSKDNVNTLRLNIIWKYMRLFDTLSLGFSYTRGLSGDVSNGSRFGEKSKFNIYNLDIKYNRFLNTKNSINWYMSAQYTNDRVPLSQAFSAGGISSVRGYDSSVKTGDYGYKTSIEWFYHPNIKNGIFKDALAIGLFSDYARVYVNKAIQGEKNSEYLWSAGVEVKANINKKYFAKFGVGFPLHSVSLADNSSKIFFWLGTKLW